MINLIFCLFFCVMPSSVLMGQTKSASESVSTEELRELQSKMKQHTQLRLDFRQTRTNAIRPGKTSKSSGQAYFVKPGMFRWELIKPTSDIKIFDGKNLFSVNLTKKAAIKYSAGNQVDELHELIDVVLDFDALLKRYNLRSATKQGDEISIQLSPKSDTPVKGIHLSVSSKTAFVGRVLLEFAGEQTTSQFDFSNHSVVPIDKNVFAIPADFKISTGN
jgi:outer membrane lipoprotein-sorting protein